MVEEPKNQYPATCLTLSELISEAVYKLVQALEWSYRLIVRCVVTPFRLLVWCLRC